MVNIGAFLALFMTSEGQILTQHEQKKQQKTCLYEEYILYLYLRNKMIRYDQ